MMFKNLPVKTKIIIFFTVIILTLSFNFYFILYGSYLAIDQQKAIYKLSANNFFLSQFQADLVEIESDTTDYLLNPQVEKKVNLETLRVGLKKHLDDYNQTADDDDLSKFLGVNTESLLKELDSLLGSSEQDTKKEELVLKAGRIRGITENMIGRISSHVLADNKSAIEKQQFLEKNMRMGINFTLATAVVILFVFLLAVFFVVWPLLSRLSKLRSEALDLAKGNFQKKIEVGSKDEMGELITVFNDMAANLDQMYSDLDTKVKARTALLEEKTNQAEKLNKLMVDRELKMVELKKELAKYKNLSQDEKKS